jgi:HEAT repeat protein
MSLEVLLLEPEQARREFRRDASPLLAELQEAGLPTEDFGRFTTLRPMAFDFEGAVPILLRWLPRIENPWVKEAIVRSLTTRFAKPVAAPVLIEEFRRTPTDQAALKWAMGNALDVVADQSFIDELLGLVGDPGHGAARQMIVLRLGRARKDPRVVDALLPLLEEEDVTMPAISALRQQLGPERARSHVARLLDHPSERIRTIALDQLRRIDRTLAKKAR